MMATARASSEIRAARIEGAKNHLSDGRGLVCTEVPAPPEDLTDMAVNWWNYYCSILLQGRCLKRPYITSIHNLCIAHMIRDAIMKAIENQGHLIETQIVDRATGEVIEVKQKLNPLLKDLQHILLDMDKLLASLGMTAYTDKVLQYDSSGGQIKKNARPPEVTFSPES